jgi:sugar O-acyltransferase (sialic acid O-acetyltransferase NeuD family)
MTKIVIFGTGGFAREVHQLIEDINAQSPAFEVLGFLDENSSNHGTLVHGLPVLGGVAWLAGHANQDVQVTVAIGNPASKRKVIAAIRGITQAPLATLIHPRAWIGNRVAIGAGSIICAGALITTDIEIGRSVIVNIGSTVGHDATLHDYVTVAPTVNISGSVVVGEGVDLGTGATIIQGKAIGAWTIVGAGSVVVRDIEANVTAVGSPAKAIKSRQAGWHDE